MINKIAFIGATGLLGKPVALQLYSAGFQVKALVRNPAKATQLPSAIQRVVGDLGNPKTLDELLNGQDAVYLNLSILQNEKKNDWHTESDGMINLIEAAKRNHVRRIVYLSSLLQRYQGMNGFHWWAFDVKQKAVQLIKESGIPYTIFYPSTFMEALDHQYKQGGFLLLAGTSRYPQYFISSADFSKQVVQYFKNDPIENKEYVIQGPAAYSTDNAVHLFQQNYTKRKLTVLKAPLGLIRFYGFFFQKLNYGYHILEAINNYPEKFEAEKTWKELGHPTITIAEYANAL